MSEKTRYMLGVIPGIAGHTFDQPKPVDHFSRMDNDGKLSCVCGITEDDIDHKHRMCSAAIGSYMYATFGVHIVIVHDSDEWQARCLPVVTHEPNKCPKKHGETIYGSSKNVAKAVSLLWMDMVNRSIGGDHVSILPANKGGKIDTYSLRLVDVLRKNWKFTKVN